MPKFLKLVIALVASLLALGSLTACAPAEKVDPASFTAIIDVRTPAEFAEGHLAGAVNIDVQDPSFLDQISQLDPAGNYFVYCRSGNRSGQAIQKMQQLGFESLINGGSVSSASGMTGLEVVQ